MRMEKYITPLTELLEFCPADLIATSFDASIDPIPIPDDPRDW